MISIGSKPCVPTGLADYSFASFLPRLDAGKSLQSFTNKHVQDSSHKNQHFAGESSSNVFHLLTNISRARTAGTLNPFGAAQREKT